MSKFVPKCQSLSEISYQKLENFINTLSSIEKLLVLTGAGISTESGIPDYRSRDVGQYARSPEHRPITIQQFMNSELWRKRYWARNYVAWPIFNAASPNATHSTLTEWEKSKNFLWHITQNVDGLHKKSGALKVTELHGSALRVVCMSCDRRYPRAQVQIWMANLNRNWEGSPMGELAPDADIEIAAESMAAFTPPHCPHCGPRSILKTDVVFFGDNISRHVDSECKQKVTYFALRFYNNSQFNGKFFILWLTECMGLLVLGSSLTVLSGYRFAYGANLKKVPLLIVNAGPTRSDHLTDLHLDVRCSEFVEWIRREKIF